MAGTISFIPTTLPPGFYEQAAGRSLDNIATHSTGVASHSTGLSGSFSPTTSSAFTARSTISTQPTGQSSYLQSQYTGQQQSAFAKPPVRAPTLPASIGSPFHTQAAQAWDVTPAEKANADRFFDRLDTAKRGYIEGDIAVPFMLESTLSEEVLALIW